MIKLGVNIDHIATLRQARYADMMDSPNCEPDILAAASACERAGATASRCICAPTGGISRIVMSSV